MQVVVDAVLAIRKSEGEPIDLHMVEIMEMMHRTDTDTKYVHSMHSSVVNALFIPGSEMSGVVPEAADDTYGVVH